MVDLSEEPPTDINPYEVLEIETTASPSAVKSAYKKLALKHHPDKVQNHERVSAHSRFQEIAFAYAILSDERRRKRYDTTGNISESLEIDDDDFNWSEFFKAQWADAVTGQKIDEFKTTYKQSEEERHDILAAYKTVNGDLDKVYTRVMLSNPLDDEDRFRGIIEDAIAAGEVEAYKAFTHEKEDKRKRRHQRACGQGREAEAYAKKLGVWDDLFGNAKNNPKSTPKDDDSALKDLIQKRNGKASSQFLDNLEAKYSGGQKKGRKRKFEEPPEELFEKNRYKTQRFSKDDAEAGDDGGEVDLEEDSPESDSEGEDNIEEDIQPANTKSEGREAERINKRATKKKSNIGNREEGKPIKVKNKGAQGREVRSPRGSKKASYVEAQSSESEFEEDEKEPEFKLTKSKGKGVKGGKGQMKAIRKKN